MKINFKLLIIILNFSLLIFNFLLPWEAEAATIINKSPNYLKFATGLVGYWTMDGNNVNWATGAVTDSSGKGNTGAITGMATSTAVAAGKIGQALSFDGVNDYVKTGKPLSTFMSDATGTISAWAYATATSSAGTCGSISSAPIFADGISGSCGYIGLAINTSLNWCAGGYDTANRSTATPAALKQWTHLVWVHSLGVLYLYKNGVLANSTALGNIAAAGMSCVVGMGRSYLPVYFSGLIDEVRVYNRALSATEIQMLYNSGAAKFNISPTKYLTSGLVGYWTMDGNNVNWATGAVTDSSGKGNTGAITGMATSTAVAAGKIGQALSFDGVNDYVDRGTGPTSVKTIAFWVYSKTTTEYFVNLTGTTDYIWVNAGTVTATGLVGPTIYVNGVVSSILSANQWQYVVVTTDTSENAGNLDIGRTQDANYMEGLIDEVRVYDRALSAGEIGQLYRLGTSKVKF